MDNNAKDFFAAPGWVRVALFRLAERHGHHWAEALVSAELNKAGYEWPEGFAHEAGEAARERVAAAVGTMPSAELYAAADAHPCGPCGGLLPAVSHRTTTGRSGWEWDGHTLIIRIWRPDALVISSQVFEHHHRWQVDTHIGDHLGSCMDRHASELRYHLRTIGRADAALDRLVEHLRASEARASALEIASARRRALLAIDPMRDPAAFDAAWF